MLLLIIAFIITCRAAVRQDMYASREDISARYIMERYHTTLASISIVLPSLLRLPRLKQLTIIQFHFFSSHNHITLFFSWRGEVMPVWGVRRVYASVPYSCTPVRVCNPCCSVTLYCVVSSTSSAGQDGDRRPTSATQAWASSNILSSQDKPQRG